MAVAIVTGEYSTQAAETVIPASWGYPLTARDATAPGFSGRIHQARRNAGLTATTARGNAQLNGALIDPQSNQPYQNLVVTKTTAVFSSGAWLGFPVNPDGSFFETNVVNYAADTLGVAQDLGNFSSINGYLDANFPGLPGANDASLAAYENGNNFTIEELAYLELKAGVYVFGVHCDDTFELAFHPNDTRDLFRKPVMGFGSNRGATETTAAVRVEADGLYPVRLLYVQYADSAPSGLEFYTVDANDPTALTLVNDLTQAGSIRAWRALTVPTRPYIRSVSPEPGATGVPPTESIRIAVANLGSAPPVLKVNGTAVTFATSTAANETTLIYTSATPFGGGQSVTVELTYANAVSSWSFVTRTGRKALLITGGGQVNTSDGWIAQRLASVFGLDVVVKGDTSVTTNDAAGVVLVVNSATVNSGQVANDNFEQLPIPILNGEGGNLDDFMMHPGNTFGNDNDVTQVEIIDNSHPLAAGTAIGPQTYSTANVQVHWGTPDVSGTAVIGVNPANADHALIFAIEKGSVIADFTHPARRVHLGIIGNTGASTLNGLGEKLFDAAITWLLPALPALPPSFRAPVLASGNVTLAWTGSGTLEEASSVPGPWARSANQNNPQTIAASGAKFYRLRQ